MTGKKDVSGAVTTTYIAYLTPGSFMSEESTRKVEKRNPEEDIKEAPEYAFAFFYFDIVKTSVKVGDEQVDTSSGRRNISNRYYIDAEVLDLKAVEALEGDTEILIRNMKGNGYDQVVRCRTGNFQPLDEKDVLLTTS